MNKVRRILLVNPPNSNLLEKGAGLSYSYFEPSLGLLYIYQYLHSCLDAELKIIDLNIELKFHSCGKTFEEIVRQVVGDFSPDMVGISALYYSEIKSFHLTAGLFKKYAPKSIVVMGGHYPTHLTEMCLKDTNIDFAILSEGEMGMADLVNAVNQGTELENVEGLALRVEDGVKINPRKNFWKGFCDSPTLDWNAIRFGDYFQEGRNVLDRVYPAGSLRMASLTASRGCPNNCTFCSSPSFWRRRWRGRRIELIMEEIRFLRDEKGVNTFAFNDENIAANKRWMGEFLSEISKLGVRWYSGGGLEVKQLADREMVRKMYDSGMCLFNMAIESGSDRTLERVNKNLRVEYTLKAIENVRAEGDGYMTGFFITGFPFETMDDIKSCLEFAGSLDIDWKCFYSFQPFPGAELYRECLSEGVVDAFDINYGENYFAADMKYKGYTAQDLTHENYLANMRYNFIENPNMRKGDSRHLEQVKRDFNYVLKLVPDHTFALNGLADISLCMGDKKQAYKYLEQARIAVENSSFDWKYYTDKLGLDILQKISRLQGITEADI